MLRSLAILATTVCTGASSFSNIKISQFEQLGLDLTFLLSWDTTESLSSVSDLIDIWLETRQSDPSSFVQTLLEQGVENTGSLWIDAGDSWAARSSWDTTLSGEAIVCIYNSTDIYDNACGEALGILPEAEAPYATAGEGISNVYVPRVAQNGSSLEFSVTWADGGGSGGLEDTAPLVDIWLTAQQVSPPARVELALQLNAQNERMSHLEVDMDWSMMGWDLNRDGQLQSCVYDPRDYENYACSDFVAFTASVGVDGSSGDSNARGDSVSGGTVLGLVILGAMVVGVVGWLAVTTSRRRQRKRWVGTPNEAEALPEEIFVRPLDAYAGLL
ncbi:unnamed protein product [Pylaiella littoralis]